MQTVTNTQLITVSKTSDDGEYETVLFKVPSSSSNAFLTYPQLTNVPTATGFKFSFSVENPGFYWAHVSRTLSCT